MARLLIVIAVASILSCGRTEPFDWPGASPELRDGGTVEARGDAAVTLDGGLSNYCAGEAALSDMITTDLWTITDGGKNCSTADLQIVKRVARIAPSKHKYKLLVTNLGPDPALNLLIKDKLPKNYTISKINSTAADCAKNGREVTCTLAQLNMDVTIRVIIVAVPNGATGKNCATVTASTSDPNPNNNKSCKKVPPG